MSLSGCFCISIHLCLSVSLVSASPTVSYLCFCSFSASVFLSICISLTLSLSGVYLCLSVSVVFSDSHVSLSLSGVSVTLYFCLSPFVSLYLCPYISVSLRISLSLSLVSLSLCISVVVSLSLSLLGYLILVSLWCLWHSVSLGLSLTSLSASSAGGKKTLLRAGTQGGDRPALTWRDSFPGQLWRLWAGGKRQSARGGQGLAGRPFLGQALPLPPPAAGWLSALGL